MSKTSRFKLLLIGVAVVCVALLLAETLIIKVQTTYVRKEPKFYSSPVATLNAGESVTQISSQAGWFKVRTSKGVEGWIHSQAVATGKLKVAAMDKSLKTSATANEVALAGKGFNRQVEAEYKSRNKDINFGEVERMLRIKVTPEELRRFLMDGKLAEFGGAR
ncbi:MAG: SH3 domain-containing protein [Candidatus Aminicenantes bacterium]|nr:MAG: SH3 domain-containing protein [Candidatus Aminicenantes bacterium]